MTTGPFGRGVPRGYLAAQQEDSINTRRTTVMQLECPACEFEFDADLGDGGDSAICPECGHAVGPSTESTHRADPTRRRASPGPGASVPRPSVLANRGSAPVAPPRPAPKPKRKVARPAAAAAPAAGEVQARVVKDSNSEPIAKNVQDPAPPPLEPIDAASHVSKPAPLASDIARQRSGRAIAMLMATGMLTVVLAGAAIGFAVYSRSNAGGASGNESQLALDDAEGDRTTADAEGSPPLPPALPPDELLAVQEQTFQYLTVIETTRGDQTDIATGVLIDTRGWILVTLRHVAGADTIVVRQTDTNSVTSEAGDAIHCPLSSTMTMATGVVAYDSEHDLALIQIPPTAVQADLDVTISIDDAPAVGSKMVMAGVRDSDTVEFLSGLVSAHETTEALPESAQQFAIGTRVSDVDTKWIELDRGGRTIWQGAPIFRADGALSAVVVFSDASNGRCYAISPQWIRQLKDQAGSRLVAFGSAELGEFASVPVDDETPEENGPTLVPASDAIPGTIESQDAIKALADQCDAMDWIPTSQDEYAVLQRLAEHVYEAERIKHDDSIEEGLQLILGGAVDELRQKLQKKGWPDEDTLAAINELAIAGFDQPGSGVFAYARIEQSPADAGQIGGQDVVVMRLIGTEHRIVMPITHTDSFEFMTADSEWLVVGVDDAARGVMVTDEEGNMRRAPLVHAIYLVEHPERIARAFSPAGHGSIRPATSNRRHFDSRPHDRTAL